MSGRPDWQRQGRCWTGTGALVDLMFPGQGGDTADAKAMCATCPVIDVCREDAIANEDRFGIWGGMSEKQRRIERRRRRKAGTLVTVAKPIHHGDHRNANRCRQRPEGICLLCLDALARYYNPDPGPKDDPDRLYPRRPRRLADLDGAA